MYCIIIHNNLDHTIVFYGEIIQTDPLLKIFLRWEFNKYYPTLLFSLVFLFLISYLSHYASQAL